MRTTFAIALLASACISDPAYIGEGPPGPGASYPAYPGFSRERMPVESGSCTISASFPNLDVDDQSFRATWDAEQRTVELDGWTFRFDEKGLEVERWSERWREVIHRDERDSIATNTAFLFESENPSESWDQANQYDAAGRLESSRLVFHDPNHFYTEWFYYTDGLLTLIERFMEHPSGSGTIFYVLDYERGLPSLHETVIDGLVTSRERAFYDDDGRLIGTEWDFGTIRGGTVASKELDGLMEFRNEWIYDDEGRLIRYESDFQSGGEYSSSVDGVPDEIWEFAPACADIAAAWPNGLYAMPHWIFPYPETRWKIP